MNRSKLKHVVTSLASLVAALLSLVLAACDSAGPATATVPVTSPPANSSVEPHRLSIVTTTTQIRSMTEAVVGDKGTVRSIITPGADPHEFEPRPSDVQAISTSDIVLKNGVGLDDWVDKIIQNAGGNRPLVVVSKDVPVRKGDEQEPGGDPHIWFSAANAITMTRNIRDALIIVDPANTSTYQSNADTYTLKLKDLDRYIFDQVATVPPDQRKMVTNHDAFGYFIDRYGLVFIGSIVPSMSTDAQPSAQDVSDLIEKVKAQHVKAIFLESSINPALARQIGSDAGVKVVDTLYGDSLGDAGTPGADYIGMMKYDTDTIVSALK